MAFVASSTFFVTNLFANPVDELLERIDKGASHKFQTILVKSDKDFFEIDQAGTSISKPSSNKMASGKSSPIIIRGNSWVNIAVGVNWYPSTTPASTSPGTT